MTRSDAAGGVKGMLRDRLVYSAEVAEHLVEVSMYRQTKQLTVDSPRCTG